MYRSSGLCPAQVTYQHLNQHMRREFTPAEWEAFVRNSVAVERARTENLITRALPRFPHELVLYIADFLVKGQAVPFEPSLSKESRLNV